MNGKERREFVRSHRTAIFGYGRKSHGPSMSAVYYVMDGDDILVSTMLGRGKAKAVQRNPQVSLCVLDEKWPPTYILVYGNARIEADKDYRLQIAIVELMAGGKMPEKERADLRTLGAKEQRVVVRITPESTFETPPRHVYSASDVKTLTHWLGSSLPWNSD